MSSEEQIYDHTDISTHSIVMPFEFTPLVHLNQLEEFEEDKQVEEVLYVHEACYFHDEPLCLDDLSREDVNTHTPSLEHIECLCKDECDEDELLFQAKFEDEFRKFYENNFVEELKISSDYAERMKHTAKIYDDVYTDNELLFLDEFFTEECDYNGEKHVLRILNLEFPLRKEHSI